MKIKKAIVILFFIFLVIFPFFCEQSYAQVICYEKECFIMENNKFRKTSPSEYKELYRKFKYQALTNQEQLQQQMIPDTSWVKDKGTVFYNKRSLQSGLSSIYMINSDGKNMQNITGGQAYKICKSADSRYLLMLVYSKPSYKVFLYDILKKTNRLLKELMQVTEQDKASSIEEISWSPDSESFIYVIREFLPVNNYAQEITPPVNDTVYLYDLKANKERLLAKKRWLVPVFYYKYVFWDKDSKQIYFVDIELKSKTTFLLSFNTESLQERKLGEWISCEDIKEEKKSLDKMIGKNIFLTKEYFNPEIFSTFRNLNISESKCRLLLECERQLIGDCEYVFSSPSGERSNILKAIYNPFPEFSLSSLANPWWLPGNKYVILQFFKNIAVIDPQIKKIGILTEGSFLMPIDYWSEEKWVY